MRLTLHRSAWNALTSALKHGRYYNATASAEGARLFTIVANATHDAAPSMRGNPLPVSSFDITPSDAIALLDLLYATAFSWPLDWAEYDWHSTIVRSLIQSLAIANRGERVGVAIA